MRLAISLSPADLAGEEGLLGLAVENLFLPAGSAKPATRAPALLEEPAQLGVVIGEEEQRGDRRHSCLMNSGGVAGAVNRSAEFAIDIDGRPPAHALPAMCGYAARVKRASPLAARLVILIDAAFSR